MYDYEENKLGIGLKLVHSTCAVHYIVQLLLLLFVN